MKIVEVETKTKLTELFDTEAEMTWVSDDAFSKSGYFTINDKKFKIEIYAIDDEANTWSIVYGYIDGNRFKLRPTKLSRTDATKILGTVMNVVSDFLKERSPNALVFSGSKGHGLYQLYESILAKMSEKLSKIGYKVEKNINGDSTKFGLIKNEFNNFDEIQGYSMKINEVVQQIDELRMGAKELSQKPARNFTIGFEFEIAANMDNFGDQKFQDEGDAQSFVENDEDSLQIVFDRFKSQYKTRTETFWKTFGRSDDEDYADYEFHDFENIFDLEQAVSDSESLHDDYMDVLIDYSIELYNKYADSEDELSEIFKDTLEEYVSDDFVSVNAWDRDSWYITTDGSIDPIGRELVSPVFNYDEAIENLKLIFDMIDTTDYMFTNSSTGLHINVGTFKPNDIDLLKLLVFTGDKHVLSMFDRSNNFYAASNIEDILNTINITGVDTVNNTEWETFVDMTNSYILRTSEKYKFFNLSKLKQYGYIEIRGLGNARYETRYDVVVSTMNRILRAMEVAMDPNAYKKEYIKKLSQLADLDSNGSPSPIPNTTADKKIEKLLRTVNRALDTFRKIPILSIKDMTAAEFVQALHEHSVLEHINIGNEIRASDKIAIRELVKLLGDKNGVGDIDPVVYDIKNYNKTAKKPDKFFITLAQSVKQMENKR